MSKQITINPKFNIGDKAYFLNDSKIIECVITGQFLALFTYYPHTDKNEGKIAMKDEEIIDLVSNDTPIDDCEIGSEVVTYNVSWWGKIDDIVSDTFEECQLSTKEEIFNNNISTRI